MPRATIHVGDAEETLRGLPESSVQTCVTSPPYWGLRDYGEDGQLGLEATPDEYMSRLVEVFREVRRVLAEDGTLWLNLGDTYARPGAKGDNSGYGKHADYVGDGLDLTNRTVPNNLKEKDLVGIPWRVALALQEDGWWLRSDIIWHKGNPMPESVTDRPTSSHEYIFLLSQSKQYFYDADAIREPSRRDASGNKERKIHEDGERDRINDHRGESIPWEADGRGRNKRDVWQVNTKPYSDAHFAVYPPELIAPCIEAGTSERGQCPKCGAPWGRVVRREEDEPESYKSSRFDSGKTASHMKGRAQEGSRTTRVPTDDWEPTCDCGAEAEPQTVLDPFSGAGTTGVVSLAKGRHFLGIDISEEYCKMAAERIRQDAPLMNHVTIRR